MSNMEPVAALVGVSFWKPHISITLSKTAVRLADTHVKKGVNNHISEVLIGGEGGKNHICIYLWELRPVHPRGELSVPVGQSSPPPSVFNSLLIFLYFT